MGKADSPEHVAELILGAIESEAVEIFAHEGMNPKNRK